MIREDRELLTELARLNRELVPLAMRKREGSASPSEQQDYGRRLIAARLWLQRRATEMVEVVINGEVLESKALTLSQPTIEPYRSL
jgi:hypothetical protein